MNGWLRWVAGVGGFDLVSRRKPRDPLLQLAALLAFHRIDLVLDVGANEGQYGAMLRRLGYGGRIQWTGDFAVLDIKSNCCGMIVVAPCP